MRHYQSTPNLIELFKMVAQPIGTKKPIAGPKPTGPKAVGPAKKPVAAQTKTVPYKKPAATPVKKPIMPAAKKPLAPAAAAKRPIGAQPMGTKKAIPPPPKNVAKPENKSWLTKTIGAASSGISGATSAAASGVGNAAGAVVSAAGNGVAGAGKGAGARYVALILHIIFSTKSMQHSKHVARLG